MFEAHFKSGLVGVDPKFLLSEQNRLVPQANIILNLLQISRSNLKQLVYAYIFSNFNFNAMPIAPPGTKIISYVHLSKRGSWNLNSKPGKYFPGGPVCRFCGKDFLQVVTYSSRGEINQIILMNCLKKIDKVELHN